MTIFDLVKATIICGLLAFFIYSYEVFAQAVVIGFLGLLWLGYAHKTVMSLIRR